LDSETKEYLKDGTYNVSRRTTVCDDPSQSRTLTLASPKPVAIWDLPSAVTIRFEVGLSFWKSPEFGEIWLDAPESHSHSVDRCSVVSTSWVINTVTVGWGFAAGAVWFDCLLFFFCLLFLSFLLLFSGWFSDFSLRFLQLLTFV